MLSSRSFWRVEAVGPLFLEPAVSLVNDELAGVVGARFFDAGADGFGLGLECGVVLLALPLEVPFVISGNDVIADPLGSGVLAVAPSWRTVQEQALGGEVDAERFPVDADPVTDEAMICHCSGEASRSLGNHSSGTDNDRPSCRSTTRALSVKPT